MTLLIFPIIELLYRAQYLGYKIVIITARLGTEEIINWTANELASFNISYDYLGFTTPQTKSAMKMALPYRFILSVGDMPTDSQHFQFFSQLRQLTNVVIGSSAERV